MQFVLKKASDLNFREKVEVNSMEELKALSARYGNHNIIVRFDSYLKIPVLLIYDDYIA